MADTHGYERCRVFGHAWDDKHLSTRNESGLYLVELTCMRCGTTRHDYWGSRGVVRKRHYAYADGYLVAKGERQTRDEYRLSVLTSLLDAIPKASRRRAKGEGE